MNRHDIIRFRASHNLSAQELVELLNLQITNKTISHYETGRYEMTSWFRRKLEKAIEDYGIDETIDQNIEFYRKRAPRGLYKNVPVVETKHPYQELKEEVLGEVELPPKSNHYNAGQVDAIDPVTFGLANFNQDENLGFYRLNAIKYVARFGKKDGFNLDDLDKAIYYINKMKEVTTT